MLGGGILILILQVREISRWRLQEIEIAVDIVDNSWSNEETEYLSLEWCHCNNKMDIILS